MNDQQKVTAAQIHEAGLTDWHEDDAGKLKAQFGTGDFLTGLVLVNKIGASAEAANHHPDITLTYPRVVVTLSSHDVGGITRRDLKLAHQISALVKELGIGPA
ncbi:MAG: 4a-hydroxytetrahydrobiopterin dehydratase [Actinomycetota bacterium]